MITLNLETKTPEHEALKQYLEENANEFLAKKINDGVRIEKDGKTLINKKTLETFMDYAHEEAKKLAAKGAKYSVIKDDIVFGWAMHYFEENDIIGTLYNEDGTEYKAAPKTTKISNKPTPAPIVSPKPAKPKPQQFNLFDIMENAEKSPSDEPMKETIEKNVTEMDDDNDGEFETPVPEDIDDGDEEPTELRVDENGEILPQTTTEKQNGNSLYQQYLSVQKQYPHAVIAYRLGDFYEIFPLSSQKNSNSRSQAATADFPSVFLWSPSPSIFPKNISHNCAVGISSSLWRTETRPFWKNNRLKAHLGKPLNHQRKNPSLRPSALFPKQRTI